MKKKRRLLFLMSIVLGGFLGMFVGMFKARVESHEIILDVKALMPWISAICLLIGFISMFLTFNFLKKSRKFHSLYQEEMDDDLNETYYVQMYRNLEFGTIAFNIRGDYIAYKPSNIFPFFLTLCGILSRSKISF